MKRIPGKFWLAILFLAIFIVNTLLLYSEGYKFGWLWFCPTLLVMFAAAILTNNKLLLSSVVVSATVIEIIWSIDAIYFFITERFLVNAAMYLANASLARKIITMYHFLLLIVPIIIVLRKKEFSKHAWMVSSLNLFAVLLLGFLFNAHNINCTQDFCNLNFGNLEAVPKTDLILASSIIWITLSFLVFLPTNLFFNFLIKKLNASKKERFK